MLRMGKSHKPAPHVNPTPMKNAAQEIPAPVHSSVMKSPVALTENLTAAPPHAVSDNPAAPRAVTESEALARDIKEGVMSGFVGGGTNLSGEANFKGMLRIDGRFTGQINSEKGTLIVSTGGYAEANIAVAEARINGTVHGDITATLRIELGRTAQVHGNIQTPALVIETGAIFEGGCRMSQSPATQQKPRTTQPQASDVTQAKLPAPPPEKAAMAQTASNIVEMSG